MSGQDGFWQRPGPPPDETPIETGGAVIVLRLAPDEVALLDAQRAETLVDALHNLLASLP